MEYLRLLYELPAIVAGTTMLSYLSPWKVQARFIPLLMFIVGLLVLTMPVVVSLALGLTIPAAWLQKQLGIVTEGHEPLNVGPVTAKVKGVVQKIRDRYGKPELIIKKFVEHAYPSPDDETAGQDTSEVVDDEPPEHEPGETVTDIPKFVPSL